MRETPKIQKWAIKSKISEISSTPEDTIRFLSPKRKKKREREISRDTFWTYLGCNLSEIHLEQAQVNSKGSAFGFQIKLDCVKGRYESHQKPANR